MEELVSQRRDPCAVCGLVKADVAPFIDVCAVVLRQAVQVPALGRLNQKQRRCWNATIESISALQRLFEREADRDQQDRR